MEPTNVYILAALMFGTAVVFIYLLLRGNKRLVPTDAMQWIGLSLSVLLMCGAIALALLAQVPQTPVSAVAEFSADQELSDPAPNFKFKLVDSGERRELEDYAGQVIVLNFWATWCAPCLKEMPELSRLQQAYGGKDVTVLTISDEPRGLLMDFGEQYRIQTESGYIESPYDIPEPYQSAIIDGRPVTFIIDRQGIMRHYFIAARTYDYFESKIEPFVNTRLSSMP